MFSTLLFTAMVIKGCFRSGCLAADINKQPPILISSGLTVLECFGAFVTEFVNALPVILSLVLIEGLLSIDNALIIATMAARLPDVQRRRALNYGLIAAYVLRLLALVFASLLLAYPALKIAGALYLCYLMMSNLGLDNTTEQETAGKTEFWPLVFNIGLVDLTFALDNVVTAVALSNELWVLVTGVFVGMAAMRVMSGYFMGLIDRFPILKSAAYLLVGYIGFDVLLGEVYHLQHPAHFKFIAIAAILGLCLLYARMPWLQRMFLPLTTWLSDGMGRIAGLVDWTFAPLQYLLKLLISLLRRKQ